MNLPGPPCHSGIGRSARCYHEALTLWEEAQDAAECESQFSVWVDLGRSAGEIAERQP